MSHFDNLTVVAQRHKRLQTKVEHRRAKLIEKLDDQLSMVNALISGEDFVRIKRLWKTDETGHRHLVERPKRIRNWYWMGAGGCFFQIWYGSKVIEIKPGMSAIRVEKREQLPDAIRAAIKAIEAGELDVQIEAIAEKGTAELKLKQSSRPARKTG